MIIKITSGVVFMTDVNVILALGAGFLSFISPCCLPLYPAFLSYITGMSVEEIKSENILLHRRSFLHTVFFLLGFSVIFIALGFSTSLVGKLFSQYGDLMRQVGAIFIIFFGLMITGIIKPEWLMKEKRITFKNRPAGYMGSVIIGLAFAAGWTPCTGPILMAVIALAATDPGAGLFYMIAYILGFAVPFMLLSFFIGKRQWIKNHSAAIMKTGGIIMIVMGVILLFDLMTKIIAVVSSFFGSFTGF